MLQGIIVMKKYNIAGLKQGGVKVPFSWLWRSELALGKVADYLTAHFDIQEPTATTAYLKYTV